MENKLYSRKNLRLSEYDYSQPGYYFVTICTYERGRDIFSSINAVGGGLCAAPPPDLTALGEIVRQSILNIPILNPGVEVDCSIVMPDHIHLILYLTGRHRGRPLPEIIGRFKSYTDHYYRTHSPFFGPRLWQESYYEHVIRNDADLSETRQYIQNNPLKWTTKD